MFGSFDFEVIWQSLPYLFYDGFRVTVSLTVLAAAGGCVLGTLLAMMRLSNNVMLVNAAKLYTNTMRSLPLMLIIFWFYFLVPWVVQLATGAPRPVPVGQFLSALVTFTMFEAAYFSEIVRAGIQSLPRNQVSAGYAIGLTYWQTMRYVVLPQALRNVLPLLLTQTIILFQDTTLVYVVSLTDFLKAASNVAYRDNRIVELYLFCAVVYFAISYTLSRIVRNLAARTAIVR